MNTVNKEECERCVGTGVIQNHRAISVNNGGFDPCPDCRGRGVKDKKKGQDCSCP